MLCYTKLNKRVIRRRLSIFIEGIFLRTFIHNEFGKNADSGLMNAVEFSPILLSFV